MPDARPSVSFAMPNEMEGKQCETSTSAAVARVVQTPASRVHLQEEKALLKIYSKKFLKS
jgi:hypothetical protein